MKRPTTKRPVPYRTLERKALLDLAARTIADPHAHDEHAQAAQRRLEAPNVDLDEGALRVRLQALSGVDYQRLREAAAIVHAALWPRP